MSPIRHEMDEGQGTAQRIFFALQVTGSIYVGFMLWLVCVLHVDDGVASRMSVLDWWYGGALRLACSLAVAMFVALLSGGLSRVVSRLGVEVTTRQSQLLARTAAGVAFTGGAVGAVEFVVTKPYF